MMKSKEKATIAELAVATDLVSRGYHVAFPFGDCDAYDLLFHRNEQETFLMERVQVKYTCSDGEVIAVKARSHSVTAGQVSTTRLYGPDSAEWVAVYDVTTKTCYYIRTSDLTQYSTGVVHLRLTKPKNNQQQGVRWASDYTGL